MHLVVRATVAAARPHARNHVTRLAFRAASGSVRNRQLSTSAPRSDLGPSNTEKPETSSGSARSESDLALWEEIEEMEEEDQFDWDAEAEEPTSEDRKLLHQSLDDQISLLHLLKKMESTETGKRVEYTEALRDTERKHGWLRGVKLPPSWIHALESGSTNSMDPEDRGQFLAMMNVARISQRSDWTVAPGELPSRFKEAMKMGQYEHLSTRDQKVLHSLVKDLLLLGVLAPKRDVLDLEKHVKAVRQREGYVPNKDEAATIKHVRSHNKEAVPMSDELNQSIHFVQQAHSLGHLDSLLAGPKGRDYKGDKVALAARDAALANGDVDLLSSEQQDRLHDAVTGEQDLVEEAQTLQQHIIETDLGVGREFGALRRLAYLIQFTNDYGDMLSEKPRMWVEKYRELLDIYGMGEGTKRQREHDDARATVEYDDERAPKRDPEAQPEKIGEAKFRRQGRRSEMDDPDEAEEDMAAEEAEGAWTSSERYRLERAFAASRGVVHLEDWPKRWQAAVWARGTMQKDVLDEVVGVERALLWKSVNRRLQILAQSHYEQKGELEARLSPTPGANTPQIRFLSDMHRLQQM
ncbi:hypothetical protein BKA62DRAFT_473427 [Auriculariales sp. MPI-PUGE-AT-0066]|nr:hypothetical protein BKA62DRAFT_473427 [Auriculariales sp. MPI-PUGE-AT-0066]